MLLDVSLGFFQVCVAFVKAAFQILHLKSPILTNFLGSFKLLPPLLSERLDRSFPKLKLLPLITYFQKHLVDFFTLPRLLIGTSKLGGIYLQFDQFILKLLKHCCAALIVLIARLLFFIVGFNVTFGAIGVTYCVEFGSTGFDCAFADFERAEWLQLLLVRSDCVLDVVCN